MSYYDHMQPVEDKEEAVNTSSSDEETPEVDKEQMLKKIGKAFTQTTTKQKKPQYDMDLLQKIMAQAAIAKNSKKKQKEPAYKPVQQEPVKIERRSFRNRENNEFYCNKCRIEFKCEKPEERVTPRMLKMLSSVCPRCHRKTSRQLPLSKMTVEDKKAYYQKQLESCI